MASTQAVAAVPRPHHFYTEPDWLAQRAYLEELAET
jgi:hypothetical protein